MMQHFNYAAKGLHPAIIIVDSDTKFLIRQLRTSISYILFWAMLQKVYQAAKKVNQTSNLGQ